MSEYKLKSKRYGGGFRAFFFDWMILILFVALVIICCVSNAQFRTMNNIMNVLRQASFISIIAMGEFFVILTGHPSSLPVSWSTTACPWASRWCWCCSCPPWWA